MFFFAGDAFSLKCRHLVILTSNDSANYTRHVQTAHYIAPALNALNNTLVAQVEDWSDGTWATPQQHTAEISRNESHSHAAIPIIIFQFPRYTHGKNGKREFSFPI